MIRFDIHARTLSFKHITAIILLYERVCSMHIMYANIVPCGR